MTRATSINLSQRWVRGTAKGFNPKLFHEQVDYEWTDGGTHGCTMDLFIILTLVEEVSIFGKNSNRVTICWIAIWVFVVV